MNVGCHWIPNVVVMVFEILVGAMVIQEDLHVVAGQEEYCGRLNDYYEEILGSMAIPDCCVVILPGFHFGDLAKVRFPDWVHETNVHGVDEDFHLHGMDHLNLGFHLIPNVVVMVFESLKLIPIPLQASQNDR